MQPSYKYTKFKVITGYILLFVLCIAGIIIIYRQINHLAIDERVVSSANKKLYITGNALTKLYEAEVISNSFLQTGSRVSFERYLSLLDEVKTYTDTLKAMTSETPQQQKIDTIKILLNEKMVNLKELMRLKKAIIPEDFYNKAISEIEAYQDTVPSHRKIIKRVVTTQDTSYIREEKRKKGFWGLFSGKVPDSTLQIRISHHTIVDTINTLPDERVSNTDSVVNILKSVWENLQQKNANLNRAITRREARLIAKSSGITEQLRRVLNDFEKEEINNSIAKILQKQEVIHSSTNIIANIGIAAFLLVILFSFFILKDISRSQRYRRELEAAQRYAAELLKSREKFMMTVTHDIKSPLSSILGYIELLNNTPVNERQRYFLRNMRSSSEHILRLACNLLDFIKLEANKIVREEIGFNPSNMLHEVNDSFLPLAANKLLELTCRIDKSLDAEYTGDALRFRQIVVNIMSNAIKYTAHGSVGMKAGMDSTHPDTVIIEIQDSGPGITEEEQELIFKEFTRLSSSEHQHIEGTGLGLTITLKLIELLDGKLSINSQPGKGSCFIIKIPLKPAPKKTPALTDGQTVETNGKDLKVLLIDDDKLQLEMTYSLLKSKGITADATTSATELAEKLSKEKYDLVLSDIQMPEINGFRIVTAIRHSNLPFAKTIPVIALSARSDIDEEQYIAAGFSAFLNKPFTSGQLFALINRLTGNHLVPSTEQPEESHQGLYSLKHIMQFADNDPEAVKTILRSFVNETRKNLEQLRQNKDGKEYDKLGALAHKMLPMFKQLETGIMAQLLAKMESKAEQPPTSSETDALLDELIPLIETLLASMEESC